MSRHRICDLDQCLDRRCFESSKWRRYDEDVLPLWVADMDFRSPEPVIRALHERVEHGVFGYGRDTPELREVIVERLQRLYDWQVSPEELIFLPGVVTGFNLACHAFTSPGDGVLLQTPVYGPMLHAAEGAGLTNDEMELTRRADGYYEIDFDLMQETINERTRIFILCNPHNPVGRVFRRDELERMAELCLRHGIVICSDEIHGDLILSGHRHVPIASLAPAIAERTITLMAPSKTYNVPGLKCSVAIVQNEELREKLTCTHTGLVHGVNILGYTAALAAYRDGPLAGRGAALCGGQSRLAARGRGVGPAGHQHEQAGRHLPGLAELPRGRDTRQSQRVPSGESPGGRERWSLVWAGWRGVRALELRLPTLCAGRGTGENGSGNAQPGVMPAGALRSL